MSGKKSLISLNAAQRAAVERASITPNQIIEHMDGLNDEIKESWDQSTAQELWEEEQKHLAAAAKEVGSGPVRLPATPTTKPVIQKKEVKMSNLDEELEQATRALEEARKRKQEAERIQAEKAAAEPEVEQDPTEAILKMFRGMKDAPSEAQVDAWKRERPNGIYLLALGKDEAYVFTYMTKSQWEKIQEIIRKGVETGNIRQEAAEAALMEKIVQHCVLWPREVNSVAFLTNSRAGIVRTLYNQIMLNSYFLNDQQAMMLTVQL